MDGSTVPIGIPSYLPLDGSEETTKVRAPLWRAGVPACQGPGVYTRPVPLRTSL